MKRLVRFAAIAAALAAVLAAVKALRRPNDPLPTPAATPSEPWPPLRAEGSTERTDTPWVPDATPAPAASWTAPGAAGGCPDGYPIKAKMSSKIFHAPGQLNYDRTTPDRCYVDAAAAEADGLRAAKR